MKIHRWMSAGLFLLLGNTVLGADGRFVQLTGWGGGKPEEVVPQAADVGFDEIIVGSHEPQYVGQIVAIGQQHKIGIYSSIQLGDLRNWKKRHPDVDPPLQEMNAEENAALQRILADKTKGKSGYQYGGEPVQAIEVLQTPLLCPHNPEVRAFFEEQIRDLLRVPGLRGIAMDYFGYQNYRCCRCPASMKAFEAWHRQHADLPRDKALDSFSLETLVDFVNGLARYARSVRADAKVACHVYPVFLPEPLYGNRLDVDFCGQTAAWYFDPLWSFEKIRAYTRVICGEEKEHFARPEGVAMIGVYTRPELYPVKSPDRLTKELQAILDGGGDRVQVCSMNDVLKDPATREVFRRMFRPASAEQSGQPSSQAEGSTYYVDVDGRGGTSSDSNPGTRQQPWQTAYKAFTEARPGDTVLFRGGVYRLPYGVNISAFRPAPLGSKPLVFRSEPGEQAVITLLRPVPSDAWQRQVDEKGRVFYAAPASKGRRVTNVTRDGVPLMRAFSGSRNAHDDTPPEALAEPLQWASSLRQGRVYLRTPNDEPPGDRIELCDNGVKAGGGVPSSNGILLCLGREESDEHVGLHLVLEDLVLETGSHGVLVRSGFVELRRCTLRKSFADLVNTCSGRVLIEDCDFYAFGESAIDVTTPAIDALQPEPRPSAIRNCRFHDNVKVRSPRQKGYNAVMLKGGCSEVLVEGNQFYDLQVTYGVLTLGGATSGGIPREGINLLARNNIFRDLSAPYVVQFAGSHDCKFVNNLVYNCRARALVGVGLANASDPATENVNPQVINNIFYHNEPQQALLWVGDKAARGLVMDYNLIADSGTECVLAGETVAIAELGSRGLEAHGVREAPRFLAPENHDFRPGRGSPAIDRGLELRQWVPNDIQGTRRPQGAGCDIGPYEFSEAGPIVRKHLK